MFERPTTSPIGSCGVFIDENLDEIEAFLRSKEKHSLLEKELASYVNEVIKIENNGVKLRKHELVQLFENIFSSLIDHETVRELLEKDKLLKKCNVEDKILKIIMDLRSVNYGSNKFLLLKEFRTCLIILFGLYIDKIQFAKDFDVKPIRVKETLQDKIIDTAIKNPDLIHEQIAERTGAALGTVKNTMSLYGQGKIKKSHKK